MIRRHSSLPEFYHQLRIILEAEMPLPEGLAEIANSLTGPLAGTCQQLAADIHRGLDLPGAMRMHPRTFPAAHVAALAASPESLPALAQLSIESEQFLAQVRTGMSYPIAMILLSAGLLAGLMLTVVPMFAESALEFGAGPSAFYAAASWPQLWWPLLALSGLGLLLHVYLMVPGQSRDAVVTRMLRHLPGAGAVRRAHDSSMLCALWAALVRAGKNDEELLVGLDDLLGDRHLRRQLQHWRDSLAQGRPLFATIVADSDLEGRFRQALEAGERSRSVALASAAEYFHSETRERGRRVASLWTLVSAQLMILTVAIVIIGLFRPLTQFIGTL